MNRAVHVSLLLSLILVFAPAGAFAKKNTPAPGQHLIDKATTQEKEYDYAGAVESLTKAVAMGNEHAKNNLALFYERGRGVEKDPAKAAELYRTAAEAGVPMAMYNLGLAYRYGRFGLEQDEKTALKWIRKAASKGIASAKEQVKKPAPEPGQALITASLAAENRNDSEEAARLERAAADLGNVWATGQQGVRYTHGRGVPQNFVVAREWFRKAADKGNATAMRNLGLTYRNGWGTDIDEKAAKSWLGKAAKKGDATAIETLKAPPPKPLTEFALTRIRVDTLAAAGDYAAAIPIWEKKAERNDGNALYNLGWVHQHGLGVPADRALAVRHYSRAAIAGHGGAVKALSRLAEQGDADIMAFLGVIFLEGKGVSQDGWLGREWIQRAALMGHAQAEKLAREVPPVPTGGGREEYQKGMDLNFSNPVQSRQWYVKAAGKGHLLATDAMGDSYVNGQGVPQDYELARLWFSRSARAGSGYGQQNYGGLLLEGLGGPADAASAVFWFQRAAEQGNSKATWALGKMYHVGAGVPKDRDMAIQWYEVAANLGSPAATRELITLGLREDDWKKRTEEFKAAGERAKKEREKESTSYFSNLARIWAYSVAPSGSMDALNSGPGTGTSDAEWWAKARARSDCLRRVTDSVQRSTYGGQSWRYVNNCD